MSDLSELTPETFLEALRECVAEAGEDYVYKGSCVYALGGKPSCLIGKALAKLGVPITTLEWMDEFGDTSAKSMLPYLGVYNDKVRRMAYAAQTAQDTGFTWGFALREAIHECGQPDPRI